MGRKIAASVLFLALAVESANSPSASAPGWPRSPECLNDIPGSDDSVVINDDTATRSRHPCGGTGDVPCAVAFLAQVLMKELNPWRISPAS